MVERDAVNVDVAGSSPASPAIAYNPMDYTVRFDLPYAGEITVAEQDLSRKGPIRPLIGRDGQEYYVVYISTPQAKTYRRMLAEIDAEAEVAIKFAGRDRRRVKREIRKAVTRSRRDNS